MPEAQRGCLPTSWIISPVCSVYVGGSIVFVRIFSEGGQSAKKEWDLGELLCVASHYDFGIRRSSATLSEDM